MRKMKDSGIAWIGEIPETWTVTQMRRVLSAVGDGTHASFYSVSNGRPLLSAKNVFEDGIHIGNDERMISEEDYQSIIASGFPQKNDILLCSVATIGRCCLYSFDEPQAFQRSVMFLRTNSLVQPQYLVKWIQSPCFQDEMNAKANISAQAGVYMGAVKELSCVLPPMEEQKKISAYLEKRCNHIRGIIAKVQHMIDKLVVYKKSLITETVTKGLHPEVARKDSGVEWIGEIPETWKVTRISRLFSAKAGGDARPEFYADERDAEHCYPVYTNTNDANQVYAYTSVAPFRGNTITVTGRGAIGHAIYRNSPYDAIIRLVVLTPKPEFEIDSRFYAYWIDNVVDFFTSSAAIGQLSASEIAPYKIPVLPYNEQQEIADYLDAKCTAIDADLAKRRALIERLSDYKRSLIYEVVTGKREV